MEFHHVRRMGACSLLLSLCISPALASPTGDQIFISGLNLPGDYGRPVLPLDAGWDITMGSGVPATLGTPITIPDAIAGDMQITVHSTDFAGIPGGHIVQLGLGGGDLNITQFADAGDLIELEYRTIPNNLPYASDPFRNWGFLIEDITWKQQNGSNLNLPVRTNEDTVYLEFFGINGADLDHSILSALDVTLGPHPIFGASREVIFFEDSLTDLGDVAVDANGNVPITAFLTDSVLYSTVEILLAVSPITGFTIGELYVPTVPGDGNGDRMVTGADFTIWADHFGQMVTPLTDGDYNNDGNVTGADFTIWADNFGFGSAPAAPANGSGTSTVPEPATILLAISALTALFAVGRRSK